MKKIRLRYRSMLYGNVTQPLMRSQLSIMFVALLMVVGHCTVTLASSFFEPSAYLIAHGVTLLAVVWFFWQGRCKGHLQRMISGVFVTLAVVWLPVIWLYQGGSFGAAPFLSLVAFAFCVAIRTPGNRVHQLCCWLLALIPLVLLLLEIVIVDKALETQALLPRAIAYCMALLGILFMIRTMIAQFLRELHRADKLGYQLREAMLKDPLTQVLNHKAIMDVAENRLARKDTGFLIMIDVDRVKRLKDDLGYKSVDMLFWSLGFVLQQEVVKFGAEVGRLGSGEFLIVISGDKRKALEFDKKIRETFATSAMLPCPVTFSSGVAQWASERSLSVILNWADDAVCVAKSCGGNKTVLSMSGKTKLI